MPNPAIIGGVVLVLCICIAVGIYFATKGGDSPAPAPGPSVKSPAPGPATAADGFAVGVSVNCKANDPSTATITGGAGGGGTKVYRYMGSKTINHYPNPDVAASWNPSWGSINTIDCAGLTVGPTMDLAPAEAQQRVYRNNGTVSCTKYCGGMSGAPWHNELPVAWGGASCVSAGKTNNLACSYVGTDPATPGQLQCSCQKSPSTPWAA